MKAEKYFGKKTCVFCKDSICHEDTKTQILCSCEYVESFVFEPAKSNLTTHWRVCFPVSVWKPGNGKKIDLLAVFMEDGRIFIHSESIEKGIAK